MTVQRLRFDSRPLFASYANHIFAQKPAHKSILDFIFLFTICFLSKSAHFQPWRISTSAISGKYWTFFLKNFFDFFKKPTRRAL